MVSAAEMDQTWSNTFWIYIVKKKLQDKNDA